MSIWDKIKSEIEHRHEIQRSVNDALAELGNKNSNRISATDVFVEKAQLILTFRARCLFAIGATMACLALVFSLLIANEIWTHNIFEMFKQNELNGYSLTLVMIKASSAGGFAAGAIIFMVSLSRAMLHEATVLLSRRHALRFGRLLVHMESEPTSTSDLIEAFKWSDEFKSAFKDIKPTQAASTIMGNVKDIAKFISNDLEKKRSPDQKDI